MAQPQHLSRHLATVLLHLNRVFIELFIEMNNCLYCCMHCVMMFCNKAGAHPCRCVQPEGSCCTDIEKKKKSLQWALRLIIPHMLCWSADSKWAGADNSERDRSLRLWFMTIWVGVQTIVESVRSFPGWYCLTVWTAVRSRQRLAVAFGTARVCLSFLSFVLSPTLPLSTSPSPPLSSHPLCPKQTVCYEKYLYSSYILEHVLFWLSVIVTSLVVCVSTTRLQ